MESTCWLRYEPSLCVSFILSPFLPCPLHFTVVFVAQFWFNCLLYPAHADFFTSIMLFGWLTSARLCGFFIAPSVLDVLGLRTSVLLWHLLSDYHWATCGFFLPFFFLSLYAIPMDRELRIQEGAQPRPTLRHPVH